MTGKILRYRSGKWELSHLLRHSPEPCVGELHIQQKISPKKGYGHEHKMLGGWFPTRTDGE
uniref:Uncharacterized protein n=1 Tax=Rhizophora mucronata TaxID=61149 RepID=A0A2P2PSG7_RHIMU